MAWSILDSGTAGFADGNSPGHVYTFPGGTAGTNNLLTLCVSSDTTVSTPSTWSLAVSDVGNIGAYIFYKVAAGTETTVTVITSGNFATAIGFIRYSGNATTTPLDKTVATRSTVSASATTAATTAALMQTGELSLAAGCLGGLESTAQTGVTWSTGYTGELNGASAGLTTTDQRILVGDKSPAGTAAETASVSWTNATNNQTQLIATFKAAAAAASIITPDIFNRQQAVRRSSLW